MGGPWASNGDSRSPCGARRVRHSKRRGAFFFEKDPSARATRRLLPSPPPPRPPPLPASPPSLALSLAAVPPAPYTLRELSPLPAASPSPAPRFTAPLHCSSDPCVLFDRLCSRIQTDWRCAYTGSIFADTTGIVRILIRMVHGLRMLRFDWEVMKCLLFFFARIDCCFAAF
jgi:hypothetical protein